MFEPKTLDPRLFFVNTREFKASSVFDKLLLSKNEEKAKDFPQKLILGDQWNNRVETALSPL